MTQSRIMTWPCVQDRIAALAAEVTRLSHHRDRAWPDQTVADDPVAEHARLRAEAELAWHRLVLDNLAKLGTDSEHRAGGSS